MQLHDHTARHVYNDLPTGLVHLAEYGALDIGILNIVPMFYFQ
jgi:hypothetical protein